MFNSGYQIKIVEGHEYGRTIQLTEREYALGRLAGPGVISFQEASVSRIHAKLIWDNREKVYLIQHMSKTNYTRVNDKPIKMETLKLGDRICMGKLVLEVQKAPKADHLRDAPLTDVRPRAVPSARGAEPVAAVAFNDEMPGDLVGRRLGHFILERELGRGSIGRVYLARHASLGEYRAVKILSPGATRDPNFLRRFQSEAKIASVLRHPNIIQVQDICRSEGLIYLVMEVFGNRSLQGLIDEVQGPIHAVGAVRIIEQLLSALGHAHALGVVHRDVKPANILLDDARGTIALTDFSISKVKDGIRVTSVGIVLGTIEYMAPELFEGETADLRADIYAVGVILYELLTGILPFRGRTNAEIIKSHLLSTPIPPIVLNPQLSAGFEEIVLRALEKNRESRFGSAEEMRAALLQRLQ